MKGFPKQEAGPKVLSQGSLIADRYSVVEVIGQGGMGVVYKARDVESDKIVAVKMVLRSNMSQDQRRFEREAKAASLLEHPNLIAIHDFGLEDDQAYLCMDFLEGKNLDEIVEKKPLTLNQFRHIFAQACSGLQHAHDKGIVHRDLKPGNLMIVERDGDKDHVVILDFGLVKLMDGENDFDQKVTKLTRTNALLGSPLYMSPEQCRTLDLDHRTDIYSLGCVMYEALTGSPPLVASTMLDVMNKHLSETPRPMKEVLPGLYVPSALERAIFHAMAKSPEDRPGSMAELAKEIESAFSGAPDVMLASSSKSGDTVKSSKTGSKKKQQGTKVPWVPITIGALVCMVPMGLFFMTSSHKPADGSRVHTPGVSPTEEVSAESAQTNASPAPRSPYAGLGGNKFEPGKKLPWAAAGVPNSSSANALSPGATSPINPLSPNTSAAPATKPVAAGAEQLPITQFPGNQISSSSNPAGVLSKNTPVEKILSDAMVAFRGGDFAQARAFFEAAIAQGGLTSDKQSTALARLIICTYRTQDLSACQIYLEKYKDGFSFNTTGDANTLVQVYEIQKQVTEPEDYGFSEKLLKAWIEDNSRRSIRPDRQALRMKMELSRVYADQSRTSDSEQILQQIISEADQFPDMLSEAKSHLQHITGGPPLSSNSTSTAGGPSMLMPPGGGGGDPRRGGPPGMEGGPPFGGPPGRDGFPPLPPGGGPPGGGGGRPQ